MIGTILVVDDERDLAATCERLLRRRGWNVVTAGTREAALAVDTPVIVVTGYGSEATRRLTLEEGAAGFLAKPFSAHDLLRLVREIVGDASGPATARTNRTPVPDPPCPGVRC